MFAKTLLIFAVCMMLASVTKADDDYYRHRHCDRDRNYYYAPQPYYQQPYYYQPRPYYPPVWQQPHCHRHHKEWREWHDGYRR